MFRIFFIAILFCSIILFSSAQDTTRKIHPTGTLPNYKTYKQVSKFHTRKQDTTKNAQPVSPHSKYKHHYYKYRRKIDSAAVKPGARDTTTVKPVVSVPVAPVDKSLNGQYRVLLSKMYRYQQPMVSALWKSTTDTLTANKRVLREAQNKLVAQGRIIDSLKADVAGKDQTLNASHSRADEVNIFGLALSKTTYNLITWGLILLFGITAVAVILRSANARHEAREKAQLYQELEEEFKGYKAKANEKEKKLARELQTERNKVDELMGRG
jgi:hypothetical protein